jgi:predicted ATPase
LRTELTSFVGKDADVAAVRELIFEHRLTTLIGPGGSGKTRLATETARTLLGDLPDGAWLVERAAIGADGDVAQSTLAALGLRDALLGAAPHAELTDRLIAGIPEREALLILDNCEHVIESAAKFADRVLGECRRLRILATSREPLGITGEALWLVEPLALPEGGRRPRRDRVWLDDRFRLLTGGSRTALPHHRTLRAVVDWSWELLTDAERMVLRRLSVFSGGASLEAAERVCAGDAVEQEQVLELVTALAEKSLLLAEGDGAPRSRMIGTIKEYAGHRLAEAGEADLARHAHLAYFTELAETAEPHLRRSSGRCRRTPEPAGSPWKATPPSRGIAAEDLQWHAPWGKFYATSPHVWTHDRAVRRWLKEESATNGLVKGRFSVCPRQDSNLRHPL